MALEIELEGQGKFTRFVARVNRSPVFWTISLLVPIYVMSFALAFVAILMDPHMYAPGVQLILLAVAALLVMSYHWFFSRYQTASTFAQWIQFISGLLPVIGGFVVFGISYLTAFG